MAELMTDEQRAEAQKELAFAILNHLEDGHLPGTAIRWEGHEIWIHTTGQVEGWLRTWLEREEITSVSDSEHIADLTDELRQARDELAEEKQSARSLRTKLERLRGEIAGLHETIAKADVDRDRLGRNLSSMRAAYRAEQQRATNAQAERDRLADRVRCVEALRDRWEAMTRVPAAYSDRAAVHAAALAASHLPDLRHALACEVWDSSVAPGGLVCAVRVSAGEPGFDRPEGRVCGRPVESEPCPEHPPAPSSTRRDEPLPVATTGQGLLDVKPEPLIDPDCRDGKCGSCVGGPCQHECHQTNRGGEETADAG